MATQACRSGSVTGWPGAASNQTGVVAAAHPAASTNGTIVPSAKNVFAFVAHADHASHGYSGRVHTSTSSMPARTANHASRANHAILAGRARADAISVCRASVVASRHPVALRRRVSQDRAPAIARPGTPIDTMSSGVPVTAMPRISSVRTKAPTT